MELFSALPGRKHAVKTWDRKLNDLEITHSESTPSRVGHPHSSSLPRAC